MRFGIIILRISHSVRFTMKRIALVFSMTGLLVLAYGLDRADEALRRYRTMTFKVLEIYWIGILIDLVFAGALVFLAWLVLVKSKRDMTIGWLFVIVGLLAIFLSTPYGWHLVSRIPNPLFGFNLFRKAAAFIAMLGLADLLDKTRLSASA